MRLSSKASNLTALLAMGSLALSACAPMKPTGPPLARLEGVSAPFPIGRIIQTEPGEAVTFDELIERLVSNDLVFVGEVHDNPEHHLIQVQVLQAIMEHHGPVTVAMEFFQAPQQPILDRYLDGQMDETAFLKEVNWSETWGFDFHFYRPLLRLAAERGTRVLAINAPRAVVKKVARSGLESLNEEERAGIASQIDLTNEAHRAFAKRVYRNHPHEDLDRFEYFYQAQCVWDDTMAENIAEGWRRERLKMVVFTGNGHIRSKFGIPDRTLKRVPVTAATLLLYPLAGPTTLDRNEADFVWLTGDHSRRRRAAHSVVLPQPQAGGQGSRAGAVRY